MQVKQLNTKDIKTVENSRDILSNIAPLMESIREQGLLQPLVVCKNGASYELVCGHRRLDAVKKLRMKEVPCNIISIKNKKDFIIKNTTENMQREDVSAFEQGRMFYKLKKDHDMNPAEIAAACSCSLSNVKTFILIYAKTPVKYRDKVVVKYKRNSLGVSVGVAKVICQEVDDYKMSKVKKEQLWKETIEHRLNSKQVQHLAAKLHRSTRLIKGSEIDDIYAGKFCFSIAAKDRTRLEKKYKVRIGEVMKLILSGHIKDGTLKFL